MIGFYKQRIRIKNARGGSRIQSMGFDGLLPPEDHWLGIKIMRVDIFDPPSLEPRECTANVTLWAQNFKFVHKSEKNYKKGT